MKSHFVTKFVATALFLVLVATLPAALPSLAVGEGVSYYISEYESRYSAYAKKHPNKSIEDVVMEVNLHLDEKNYQNVVEVSDPESLTVLLNKHFALPTKYKPKNLVKVDEQYAVKGVTLREDCYNAFLLMVNDMEKEGLSLYIKSGYRKNPKRGGPDSLQYAWPGHSEHQTGLAFDLCKKGVTYKTLNEYNMQDTDEFAWLKLNAYRYGFIMSFPPGRSDITNFGYEPWHWRYVGTETACKMKRLNINTLCEYWAKYLCKAALTATPKPAATAAVTPSPAAATPTAKPTAKPSAKPTARSSAKPTPKPTKRPVKTPVV